MSTASRGRRPSPIELKNSDAIEQAGRLSSRERCAAAAGGGRIGIAELETAAVKAGLEVDDHALQEWRARAVDINFHAVPLKHGVIWFLFLVEIELVRMAGAAAVSHRHAQT